MHVELEQLQRLLHDELAAQQRTELQRHLASCGECRERSQQCERDEAEINAMLAQLNPPASKVDAAALLNRAHQPEPFVLRKAALTRAAVILLALGLAGTAYALPGSPLPGWIRGITARLREPEVQRNQSPAATPAGGGIAVRPGPVFVIRFSTTQTQGHARVVFTANDAVTIVAALGNPRFTSDERSVVIENQGVATDYLIEIPRTAAQVEILVGQQRIFHKLGDTVTAATARDAGGAYLLPLR